MHLVFLNQYYPPDAAPTGVMLEAVVAKLVEQGHEVTVICAKGGYAGGHQAEGEKQNLLQKGPRILRTWATRFGRGTYAGKVVDYLSYYFGAAWHLARMSPKPDRIVALTTPPYLSVLARMMSRLRGADHAHWVMDLYPDVMVAHGMLRAGGFYHRVLRSLARWGFGGARQVGVLTLGPDMLEKISCLDEKPIKNVAWVPLWSTAEETGKEDSQTQALAERRRELGWQDDDFIVMYSGNMGLGHRFGEILNFISHKADHKGPSQIRFAFFGDGKRRVEIENCLRDHSEVPLELHGYAPSEILRTHLQSADLHFVSLAPEWTGTMLPSKLQGIFAVGRPVIFLGDPDSSLGRWVEESGGGWVVAPDSDAALAEALAQAREPGACEVRGKAARAFAEEHFDQKTNVARVVEIFSS